MSEQQEDLTDDLGAYSLDDENQLQPEDTLVDDTGDVRAEDSAPGLPEPTEARVPGRAGQALPVAEVDRRGSDAHAHLTGAGRGYRQVHES